MLQFSLGQEKSSKISGSMWHPSSQHKYLVCTLCTPGDGLEVRIAFVFFFFQLAIIEVLCDTVAVQVIERSLFQCHRAEGRECFQSKSYCECLDLKGGECWKWVVVQIISVLLKLTSWWYPLTEIGPRLWSFLMLSEPNSFEDSKPEDLLKK